MGGVTNEELGIGDAKAVAKRRAEEALHLMCCAGGNISTRLRMRKQRSCWKIQNEKVSICKDAFGYHMVGNHQSGSRVAIIKALQAKVD